MELTFFDVETPNRMQDRVCSIAAVKTDLKGNVIATLDLLIDPEEPYDPVNTNIHGISTTHTKGKANLLDSWSRLAPFFTSDILIAHNAPFDLNVLDKALAYYGIHRKQVNYICTCSAAKSLCVLENYRLSTLCNEFGIALHHHHKALDDATACKDLFFTLYETGGLTEKNIAPYTPKDFSQKRVKPSGAFMVAMSDLYGIALGINIDSKAWQDESTGLLDWKKRNQNNASQPFFKEVFEGIDRILEDGIITEEEVEQLINISRPFLDTRPEKRETQATRELIGILRGIMCDDWLNEKEIRGLKRWLDDQEQTTDKTMQRVIAEVNEVLADGVVTEEENDRLFELFDTILNPLNEDDTLAISANKFVLTGGFVSGTKSDIEQMTADNGGTVMGSVSKKVNYVVVGGLGSDAYSFGNYGTKVKKAMELQADGIPIKIIEEHDLMEAFQDEK